MSTPPPADPIGPDLFKGTGGDLPDDTEPYRSGGHSVQISDGDIDNIVTLYRLRRASGRPADDT